MPIEIITASAVRYFASQLRQDGGGSFELKFDRAYRRFTAHLTGTRRGDFTGAGSDHEEAIRNLIEIYTKPPGIKQ